MPIAVGILVLISYLVKLTFLPEIATFPLYVLVVVLLVWIFEREVGYFFGENN